MQRKKKCASSGKSTSSLASTVHHMGMWAMTDQQRDHPRP
jgi:hypothetical protein